MALNTYNKNHHALSKELKIIIPLVCQHCKINESQIFFYSHENSYRALSIVMLAAMECGYSIINLCKMFFMHDFLLKRPVVYEMLINAYMSVKNNEEDNLFFNQIMNIVVSNYNIDMSDNKINNKDGVVDQYIADYLDTEGIEGVILALRQDFDITITRKALSIRINKLKL